MPRGEYRLRVPDDDAAEWIRVLREAHFTENEMESVMSWLNRTYLVLKAGEQPDLDDLDEYFQEQYGRRLSRDERETLLRSMDTRQPR